VGTAYRLFTKGSEGPITIAHLRRVARELKEDVNDEMLRNMILEANGGAGLSRGVEVEDFERVMVRAGVFQ
jgi:hydroxyacylglutathione hydrolase